MAKGKYKYWLSEDGLTLLAAWARDGLTDEQIAKNAGITTSTLYAWKIKYPEISEAIKKGKEIVDIEVENALLKRAKGYSYTEKRMKMEHGNITEIITVTKEVPPDVGAAALWLKNRCPEKWRDTFRQAIAEPVRETQPDLSGITDDDLRKMAKMVGELENETKDERISSGAACGSGPGGKSGAGKKESD